MQNPRVWSIKRWSDGTPILYGDWLHTRNGILLSVSSNVMSFRRRWGISRSQYQGGVNPKVNHIRLLPSVWTALVQNQPTRNNRIRCTGKFLSSKTHSPWIKIPCDERIENSLLICEKTRYVETTPDMFPSTISYEVCSLDWLLLDSTCFRLVRFSNKATFSASDSLSHGFMLSQLATLDQALTVSSYFTILTRAPFKRKTILVQSQASTCISISSGIWTDMSLNMSKTPVSNKTLSCFIFSTAPDMILLQQPAMIHKQHSCLHGHFACSDETCILERYICDGKAQCPDQSDEMNCRVCIHRELQAPDATFCYNDCLAPDCVCSEFYFQCISGGCVSWRSVCDCVQDCTDHSDELACEDSMCIRKKAQLPINKVDELFHCGDGQSIEVKYVNDMLPDCQNQADEEISLHTNNTVWDDYCQPPETLPCAYGYPVCFSMTDLCVARFEDSGVLVGCRNGAHLENCDEFQCPRHFKCPSAYCIPTHYVCNGVFDCPHGEDEMSCTVLTCPGLLKCHRDNLCVHPDNINDGRIDCVQSEDDEDIPQKEPCAWNQCRCRSDILICSNLMLPSTPDVQFPLRVLDISGTVVTLEPHSFMHMQSLIMLDLSGNDLKEVPLGAFKSLKNLIILRLENNNLTRLAPKYFTGLTNLRKLTLFGNPLSIISTLAFSGLMQLPGISLASLGLEKIEFCPFCGMISCASLNLSNNALSSLNKGMFFGLSMLDSLDLRGNPLLQMGFDTFASRKRLHAVFFPHSSFCCVAKEVEFCIPPLLGAIHRCHGLISLPGLNWVSGVLSGIIVLLNITSLAWWVFSAPKAIAILMILVSLSDLLMGISIGVVVSLDTQTQNAFLSLFNDVWRRSLPCVVLSALAIFSYGMSQYFLICLSACRLVVVVYPFMEKQVHSSPMLSRVSVCGCIAFTGVVFLVLTDGGTRGISAASETCSLSSFVLSDAIMPRSLLFFFVVNGPMALTAVALNCWVIHALMTNRSSTITESHMRKKHSMLATFRLTTYSFAAVIAWLPLVLLVLIQLGSVDHSTHYNAVASLVLIPLNALVNPVLYSLTSPQFIRAMKGYFMK